MTEHPGSWASHDRDAPAAPVARRGAEPPDEPVEETVDDGEQLDALIEELTQDVVQFSAACW